MNELTTEEVKRQFTREDPPGEIVVSIRRAEFDMWFAQVQREAKAEALREAADEWTQGEWAGATRYHNRAADRLASAQYAGDWLRARADRMEAGE